MSEEVSNGYTVSFKTDEGYAASLIVVRGDDVEDLNRNLDGLTEDLIEKVVNVRQLVLAANVAASGTAAPAQAAQPAQDATVTQLPGTETKTCAHGVRVFKSGTNSRGAWKGWMCPQPKNASDKCDPIWG